MKVNEELFYNGDKLWSLPDVTGASSQCKVLVGNRSSGKTTYCQSRLLSALIRKRIRKIGYIVRYKYELEDVDKQFYEPISFRFPDIVITQGKVEKRGYVPIYANDVCIGYGIALASADNIKKISNLFNDVDFLYWDEFQREDNRYLTGEATKLKSIITSIGRAPNEMVRPVPFLAVSNAISLLCPMLSSLEAQKYLKPEVKFYRGDGFTIEQNINEEAYKQRKESGIMRALDHDDDYIGCKEQLTYLNDKGDAFQKLKGINKYCYTIKYNNKEYAVRYFTKLEKYFCGGRVDVSYNLRYTTDEQCFGYMWTAPPSISQIRVNFQRGMFVFEDAGARDALINFIKY